ncbi:hypothetical protein [Rhizobium tumorigenes]|uniref:Uncharacterized protein n=1 Tax=Rhizobium tumorigenes TaxID=2041385 RepID=A0AAF1KGQ8_9HYPH|nr:hypothetical protein [Rhizobium tumorigenes]WFR96966.1 hypothetical protein PR017_07610 [Rhizobium tumorigenes]
MPRSLPAYLIAALVVIQAPGAFAADPAVSPVKTIMDATVANWAGGDSDWQDMFDASHLRQLFSADFIRGYQAAQNYPATEDGISPFDYDVIVGSQDACPLENVTIVPGAVSGGKTEVVVRFQKSHCMGADDAAASDAFTEVRFEVLTEGGKPVVDDILTTDDNGKPSSLKAAMQDIAKQP